MLILAGITIMYVMGDNGVFGKAQEAKERTEQAKQDEQEYIGNLGNDIDNYLNGNGGGAGPDVPKGPNGKPLASTVTDTNHETTKVEDKHGNEITVPEGFKVVEGSVGEEITVQNGVVIEDSAGNQFVWIPVGEVTLNDGTTKKEIKLGRYTFDKTTGNPTMAANSYQYAYIGENPNYTNPVTIESYYQELSTARDGVVDTENSLNNLNATAKDLAGFVESVQTNGGYYLGRYEASYGSGYNSSGSTDGEKYGNAKPLSKPSTANGTTMNYTQGTLWNNITQLNAAKVARNMYAENKDSNGNNVGVESDLVNSYAWDTAIVYITEMGNTNFANKEQGDVGSTRLANTGGNSSDKFCNVYDMVANTNEWTTEMYISPDEPCVLRGGVYPSSIYYTAGREGLRANAFLDLVSFRLSLYIK